MKTVQWSRLHPQRRRELARGKRGKSDLAYPGAGSQLAFARLATALAFVSTAAMAVGALAIRTLAIRSLRLKDGEIERLKIGELEVGRLRVRELIREDRQESGSVPVAEVPGVTGGAGI